METAKVVRWGKIDLVGNGTVLWGLSVGLVTSKRCAIRRWVTEDGKLNRKVFF